MDRNFKQYSGKTLVDEGTYDLTWAQVRKQRNIELRHTDWRALKDVVLPNAWKEYRQALRDLPQDHDTANDAADNCPVMPDE